MKVIKIPKTPTSAFNPGRPASVLLRAQVEHLEAATGIHAGDPRKRRRPRTESEAAKYIEELTRGLHPAGATAPSVPPAAPTVPAPTRRRARSRSAAKKSPASNSTRSRKPRSTRRTTR